MKGFTAWDLFSDLLWAVWDSRVPERWHLKRIVLAPLVFLGLLIVCMFSIPGLTKPRRS